MLLCSGLLSQDTGEKAAAEKTTEKTTEKAAEKPPKNGRAKNWLTNLQPPSNYCRIVI